MIQDHGELLTRLRSAKNAKDHSEQSNHDSHGAGRVFCGTG